MNRRIPSGLITPGILGPTLQTGFITQPKCAYARQGSIGDHCDACTRDGSIFQHRPPNTKVHSAIAAIVHEAIRSPGQTLDENTRGTMEARFRYDFSKIRVHTDTSAERAAKVLNARAFAVGPHIAFGLHSYEPHTKSGMRLLAHELTHTLQQRNSESLRIEVADSEVHEREANQLAAAVVSGRHVPAPKPLYQTSLARQKLGTDEPPAVERNYELEPRFFLKPMEATAPKEESKCEEFPGGSTDCEVDEATGIPTGKVTTKVDENNSCTKTCVEQHEAVHVKQMKVFCPTLRKCYLDSDKGQRPASECWKMALSRTKEFECEAYKISLPCVERRLKNAKECQSKENKEYGTRKLASERCFKEKACGGSGSK